MSDFHSYRNVQAALAAEDGRELSKLAKSIGVNDFATITSGIYEAYKYQDKSDSWGGKWIRSWFSERPYLTLTESANTKGLRATGQPVPFDAY